jgi:TetR/AcrR family transcriptional regulator, regulator of cefoperazone and chloramphenicol sensitivity
LNEYLQSMAQPTAQDSDSARGDLTRQRLLETAVEIFAHSAYDSVRTRMLADAAGVNQAAIPYYFGGKEGLYLAVAQRIAERLGGEISALTAQAAPLLDEAAQASDDAIELALRGILADFARVILIQPEPHASAAIILREQQQPTKAFDLLYRQAMAPLHCTMTALVARLDKLDVDSPEAILHAHMLLGQVLGFIAARTTLLRRLGQQQIEPPQIEYIASLLRNSNIATGLHEPPRTEPCG